MNHKLFQDIHDDFYRFRIKTAVERIIARVGDANALLGRKLTKSDLIQMLKHDAALFRRMGLDPRLGADRWSWNNGGSDNVKYSARLAHSIWSTIKRAQDQSNATTQQTAPPVTEITPQQPSSNVEVQGQQAPVQPQVPLSQPSQPSQSKQELEGAINDLTQMVQGQQPSSAQAATTPLPVTPDQVTSDFVKFYQRRVDKYLQFNNMLNLASSARVSGSWTDMGTVLYNLQNIDPELYEAIVWLNKIRRARREGHKVQVNIQDPTVQKHMVELFRFGIFRLMYEANPDNVLKDVNAVETVLKQTINDLYGKLKGTVDLTIEDVDRIIHGFAEDMNMDAQTIAARGNFNTAQQISAWFSNLDPLQKISVLLGIPLSVVGGLGMFMGGSTETSIALILGLILLGMGFFSKDIQALFQQLLSGNQQTQQPQKPQQTAQQPAQQATQQQAQQQTQTAAQPAQAAQQQTPRQ